MGKKGLDEKGYSRNLFFFKCVRLLLKSLGVFKHLKA